MITLFDLLNKSITENYDKVAVKFENHTITYAALIEIVNKLANGLLQLEIKKGDRILLIMPNIPHYIFGYYAILRSGAILVPVNFLFKNREINEIIESVNPACVIIWQGFYNRLKSCIQKIENIIILGDNIQHDQISLTKLIANTSKNAPDITIENSDTAIIYFTPGIVDNPKGIELSFRNIINNVLSINRLYPACSTDIYSGLLPLFHLFAQHIMNSALTQGAEFFLYQKFNPRIAYKALYSDNITCIAASPRMYDLIINDNSFENKQHSLKLALVFGDYCSDHLRKNFKEKFGLRLIEGYGVAETAGVISLNQLENDFIMDSVGRPIDNVEVKIVNENKEDVKHGEIGEILVSGNNVMKGYWNQPEKTSQVIKNGWFHTGDLGKIDDDGTLYFIEKKDDAIIKGGFHIYPKEIEDILLKHPKVEQTAIIGIPDPFHKQEVKACIILKEGEKATHEEIIEFCKEHVPVYKCPQIVQFYRSFPKSSTGRILKRKLRESI